MQKQCLKCGHIGDVDESPLAECQKCGAIYSRVEAAKALRSVKQSPLARPANHTKWLYLAIGALTATILGLLVERSDEKAVYLSPPIRPQGSVESTPVLTASAKNDADGDQIATKQEPVVKEAKSVPSVSESIAEAKQVCAGASDLAKSIMKGRQNGAPMSELMEIKSAGDGAVGNVTRLMVISAYARPRYSSAEFVEREIQDFQNEMYLACIQAKTKT